MYGVLLFYDFFQCAKIRNISRYAVAVYIACEICFSEWLGLFFIHFIDEFAEFYKAALDDTAHL